MSFLKFSLQLFCILLTALLLIGHGAGGGSCDTPEEITNFSCETRGRQPTPPYVESLQVIGTNEPGVDSSEDETSYAQVSSSESEGRFQLKWQFRPLGNHDPEPDAYIREFTVRFYNEERGDFDIISIFAQHCDSLAACDHGAVTKYDDCQFTNEMKIGCPSLQEEYIDISPWVDSLPKGARFYMSTCFAEGRTNCGSQNGSYRHVELQ